MRKKMSKKIKLKVGDLSKKLSPLPIEAQVKAVKERKKQMGPKDMKAGIDVEVNELEIYIEKPEPKKQETEIIDYEMVEEVMRKYNLNEAQRYKPRKRKLQHEKKFKIKRTHSIKVRKSQPLNKFRICTMDCEAVTFNQETKEFGGSESIDMVGFYDGENYYQFTKGIELLDYIWDNMDKYNKCYIYAHNFSGYDIYAFLDDLRTLYVKNYSVIEINGRFVEFSLFKTVRGKRYIVTFRDSYRLMPDKLDNLGKAFGYPKTEQPPFDHNIYALPIIGGENYYNKMYNLVTKYNKNDCVILYNIIYDFFSLVYGYYKSIPLTIPALAFKVWKKKNKVKVCSDITNSYEFDDYIRRSYSGGRTEVFKMFVDNDKYCYVDVNCYSEDTECWTDEGWKKYDELKVGMKVLTYNTKNKIIEMKPIKKIFIKHYKGIMNYYRSREVDCVVTPNHRMYIKRHILMEEEILESIRCPKKCLFPDRENGNWYLAYKKDIIYEGIVWCINVDNNNFLTRRNGKETYMGNSLYPYIMEKHEFPIGKGIFEDNKERVRNYYDKDIPGFYKVKWVSPSDLHIPILWQKVGGKLTFPLNKSKQNKGDGCYALPELKLAEREGYQLTFEDCVIFPKTNNMFRDYVNDYKNMKFEGGAKKVIAKLFSNCFSSDTEAWTTEGWKKWDELKQGMQCLTVNPKTKRLEYYPIRHVFLQDYEGDMCHFKNENIDMLVTPNHRVRYLINKKGKGLVEEQCYADEVPPVFNLKYINDVTEQEYKLSLISSNKHTYDKQVPYKGKVWCVSLDDREFLVRRNNKTFFSLQSLYGKFGQKTAVMSCVNLDTSEVCDLLNQGFVVDEVDPNLGLYNIEVERFKYDIVVSWSSYITALARVYMWEGMKRCNFDIAYMDSVTGDSNIYTDEGMFKIEDMFDEDNKVNILGKEYCNIDKKVLSYNLEYNKTEYVKPLYLMRHKVNKKGYTIYYNDNKESLSITDNHSIFTYKNDKIVLVKGEDIPKMENLIRLNDNCYDVIPISKIEEILINDYVYDFETPNHTFCVKNILVHNTDSFVINKEYVDRLWLDPKLYGAFKREYEIKRAMFISPKFYLLDAYDNAKQKDVVILKVKGLHDVITKGIAAKGYDYAVDFILDHAKNEKKINVSSIVQFKMSRRLKDKPRSGSSRLMVKRISLNYDKRKVCPDGVETEPW